MRLKTKLVLAITALVFLIAGLVSLVYASQLLHAAVEQAYDINHMVAEQIKLALQNALETGLRNQKVDPNDTTSISATAIPSPFSAPILITKTSRCPSGRTISSSSKPIHSS